MLAIFKKEEATRAVWLQTVLVSYLICIDSGKIDIYDIINECDYQRRKRLYDEIYPDMSFEKNEIQDFLMSSKHIFYADKVYNECQNVLIPMMGDRLILLGGSQN